MTVKELINHLLDYNPDDIIAYDLWQVDDVRRTGNRYAESEVTQEQAEEVLRRMDHHKDCNIGLNWDVMNYHLSEVLAEAVTRRSSQCHDET
jgi:hypothetical protein